MERKVAIKEPRPYRSRSPSPAPEPEEVELALPSESDPIWDHEGIVMERKFSRTCVTNQMKKDHYMRTILEEHAYECHGQAMSFRISNDAKSKDVWYMDGAKDADRNNYWSMFCYALFAPFPPPKYIGERTFEKDAELYKAFHIRANKRRNVIALFAKFYPKGCATIQE